MSDKVVAISKPTAYATINVNVETAPLLLELCAKAAVQGAQARLLADLYDQAERAHRLLVIEGGSEA